VDRSGRRGTIVAVAAVGLFVIGMVDVGWCERSSPQPLSAAEGTWASAKDGRTPAMDLALPPGRSSNATDATPLGSARSSDATSMEAEALEAELDAGIASPQRERAEGMASPEGWVGLIP
jgi:hypothetical protein